jgi:formylglycine-generating enzyme required for sulfatase activity
MLAVPVVLAATLAGCAATRATPTPTSETTEVAAPPFEQPSPTPAPTGLASVTQVASARPSSTATTVWMPAVPAEPTRAQAGPTRALETAGITLLYVPGGEFTMGSRADDRDASATGDEFPAHRVYVESFWIGRTEVSNAQYRRFIEAGGYTKREHWTGEGWQWKEENGICEPWLWGDKRFDGAQQPVVAVSRELVRGGGICRLGGWAPADGGRMGVRLSGERKEGVSLGECLRVPPGQL